MHPFEKHQKFKLILLLITCIYTLFHNPLAANSYLTNETELRLNDSQIIKIQLLHEEGFFSSDPTRLVISDGTGRFTAIGPMNKNVTLNCNWSETSCWGYDHTANEVHVIDAGSFDNKGLEIYEVGESFQGFKVRNATLFEFISAEVTYIISKPLGFLSLIVLAAFFYFTLIAGLCMAPHENHLLWFVCLLLLLGALCLLLFLIIIVFWITDYCAFSGFFGLLIGVGGVEWVRRRKI
ncbi:hypothetical protein WJT86_00810 [Microvirga sp. W0021]|uniref:Uncharacterized protein n=1 Tax=Hohaiivirga grylli TaxID=3133970 RepID=A0ABV0BFX1_9HYPH